MASKKNNHSTKTLHQLGLLSDKAMRREQQDFEKYFKEKVRKDQLEILKTLDLLKVNNQQPIIIFQENY